MAKSKLIPKLQDTSSQDVMAQLLSKSKSNLGLSVGAKVTGTVVEVGSKSLILDIGAKAEGLVSEREFESVASFAKTLKPGDRVEATVVIPETRNGQALLSIRDAAAQMGMKYLAQAFKNGEVVDALVLQGNRGGLTASVFGVEGFIPSSQLGSKAAKQAQNLEGRTLQAKIIEFDEKNNKLVLSEKAVSERELMDAQEKALQKVKKGDQFTGKVVGLTNFGAFVQIQVDDIPLEGLVHLSEISWERVGDPTEVLQPNQEVEVVVIGKEEGRLALSLKQMQEDPWETKLEGLKEDQKVKGKVTKLGDFGAEIELKPNVIGKVALNKIPDGVSLREGDLVDVFVESIDKRKRTISLGLVLTAKPVGYK